MLTIGDINDTGVIIIKWFVLCNHSEKIIQNID